ncbi:MAG: hypothetical protein HQ572_06455 [Candidatus Omnitrophica bacterium]|nr:hypothetical protein [Candidatus Omnitrophota bacterium]
MKGEGQAQVIHLYKSSRRRIFFAGLTLVELTIAIAIFVIAACGIVSLFISCATFTDSAGNITRMTNVARQELEDNVRSANFATLNTYSQLPPNVPPRTSLACYVQNHPTVNDIKQVIIVVCYEEKSNRVLGEDQNLNGVLDGGEDSDGNGRLSSLCEVATYIARTE